MDYQKTAEAILDKVGGASNVSALEHCSTRLRFTLADDAKADLEALKKIPGVMGVVSTAQTQVIIGNDVVEVYQALRKLPGLGASGSAPATPGTKATRNWGAVLIDFIVGVFQPLVPAIAGAGVLKSLLLLVSSLGWLSTKNPTYIVLSSIADATFFFLPLMVAGTTATKLGVNRLVAIAAVAPLVLPALTAQMKDPGLSVFGLPITNVPYNAQVFPSLLIVLFLAVNERFWTRVSPKPIRIFFVPMMSLLITVPVGLVLLGPLGYNLGLVFTGAILWVFGTFGWVATALLAMALPFLVSLGMHKPFLPYAINQYSTTGSEPLYLASSLAHNIAESGAMFGVAFRTKNTELRSTAVSSGISALFGITEPALYGVTIQNKRALWSVLVGAGLGGAYVGLTHVTGHAIVGPGLASMSLFINPANPMNIVNAFIGFGIAFVGALVASLLLWRDSDSASLEVGGQYDDVVAAPAAASTAAPASTSMVTADVDVRSPMTGSVIALTDVPDAVFASGALGQGVAVVPSEGAVVAPADATVVTVFESKHAISLVTDGGAELLIHIGLDTVKLKGAPFEVAVENGQHVRAGDLLATVDLAAITEAGYDTTTPIVVLNTGAYELIPLATGQVAAGDPILALTRKESADAVS
ncbi:MAG: beta-glucoside-specific PTS transporter subunit IIABC [Micropruina sp.]|uniref:beta-glucoside-specific PTS transporter subunit IIABC n=1 Tax=Micropruina sp. TaxID=2737536 RepID=UPI0039E49EC0